MVCALQALERVWLRRCGWTSDPCLSGAQQIQARWRRARAERVLVWAPKQLLGILVQPEPAEWRHSSPYGTTATIKQTRPT